MDILLLLGVVLAFGLSGGRIFQRFKIPQVVGYILIGAILSGSVLGFLDADIIRKLSPINTFALGLIGFMIGGELKLSIFKKLGRVIFTILLAESLCCFFLVTVTVWIITHKLYLGLIFGALSTATAPAATVDVLWEYKAKGILTTTILAIVGLDDALALVIYAFAAAYAKVLIGNTGFSLFSIILGPVLEIIQSALLGIGIGVIVELVSRKIKEESHLLSLTIAGILACSGLANMFHLSQILATMCLGITLVNWGGARKEEHLFRVIERFTPPIYILFFVLVGARLRIDLLPKMGFIGIGYIAARTLGKMFGSNFGAKISKAEEPVRKYLGMALFSQAGVAIGLAIAVSQEFMRFGAAGESLAVLVINVITATTFFVQIIGPPCVKYAIMKAGEVTIHEASA